MRHAAIHAAKFGSDDQDFARWIIGLKMLGHLQRLITREQKLVTSGELWAWYNGESEAPTCEESPQGSNL